VKREPILLNRREREEKVRTIKIIIQNHKRKAGRKSIPRMGGIKSILIGFRSCQFLTRRFLWI